MVPLRAYTGISESEELALQVYNSSDCSTMRLHVAARSERHMPKEAFLMRCTACRASNACCAMLRAGLCHQNISCSQRPSRRFTGGECGRAAHCTWPEVPGAQMGVVSPCSITHWLGVQGKASGSSIPAVTKRPIRMQGSAMRHHLRPCTQRGVCF